MTDTVMRLETLKKRIDFEVEMKPISTDVGVVPGHKAIVRTDTNRALSVVSDKYKVIRHDEVIVPPVETLIDRGFKLTKGHVIDDGAKVVVEMMSTRDINVNGDEFKEKLLLINSYDRTAAFQVKFGMFRLVCKNGMGIWTPDSINSKIKHLGEKAGSFDPKDFLKYVNGREAYVNKFIDVMAKMRDYKVENRSQAEKILEEFQFGKTLKKDIIEKWKSEDVNSEKTLYGLYNAITSMYSRKVEHSKNVGGTVLSTQEKTVKILKEVERKLPSN